jgi:hypothetical protein
MATDVATELATWLSTRPSVTHAEPTTVTIGRTTYQGASYTTGRGEWLYLIGDIPASFKASRKVCFRIPGDDRDWYVAGWWQGGDNVFTGETEEELRERYHPFGYYVLLNAWDEDALGETIDRHETTPYRRMNIRKEN